MKPKSDYFRPGIPPGSAEAWISHAVAQGWVVEDGDLLRPGPVSPYLPEPVAEGSGGWDAWRLPRYACCETAREMCTGRVANTCSEGCLPVVKGIAPSEVMHLLDYLRRAGVSVKRIGSTGFSVSGSPVHLEALTVLALDELRTEKKGV